MKPQSILILAACGLALGPRVNAALHAVPQDLSTTDAPGSLYSAFLTYAETPLGMRYQQIMDAEQLPSGPILINGISFRPDQIGSNYSKDWSVDLELRLSTTSVRAQDIGPVFADNLGGPATTVRAGEVTFSVSGAGGTRPSAQPFNIHIAFDTPYLYDPSQGSLLLEAEFPGSGTGYVSGGPGLDFFASPLPVGIGYAYNIIARGDTNSIPTLGPEADFYGSGGLILQLDYSAVPEPEWGAAAIALGLAGWAFRHVRARQ